MVKKFYDPQKVSLPRFWSLYSWHIFLVIFMTRTELSIACKKKALILFVLRVLSMHTMWTRILYNFFGVNRGLPRKSTIHENPKFNDKRVYKYMLLCNLNKDLWTLTRMNISCYIIILSEINEGTKRIFAWIVCLCVTWHVLFFHVPTLTIAIIRRIKNRHAHKWRLL